MGRAKALLPLADGDTFVTRIVRTLVEGGADDVIVVLGHEAREIAHALEERRVAARLVVNAEYDKGQWSSLVAGLAVADRPGVDAVLVTLVDVPFVAPA